MFGQASQSAGVYGVSPVYGVWGQATTGWDVCAQATGNGGIGVYGQGGPNGFAGYFNGNVYVTGQICRNGVPLDAADERAAGGEDVGEARLVAGRATVTLDPAFAEAAKDVGYLVVLTEEEDSGGLYFTGRGPKSFQVRARRPDAAGSFTYRVVAKVRRSTARPTDRAQAVTVEPKDIEPPVAPRPPKVEDPTREREGTR